MPTLSERGLARDANSNAIAEALATGDYQTLVEATALVDTVHPNLNTVMQAVAVTATADGLTTGIIPDGADFVTVTSANADHIVTLPAPVPGTHVTIYVGATGYELRSSAPATVGINGGTGAGAESAIATLITTHCVCATATNWICDSRTAAGVAGVTQVAAA